MKIVCTDKNNYKVYINKYYYQYNENDINKFVMKIILFLKKNYNVEIYSIFNINCYLNNNYGMILEIKRDYDPFILYSKDTKVILNIINVKMLYCISDYFIKDLFNIKVYTYNNKYYIDAINDIRVFEYIDDIVYSDTDKIINNI